MVPKRGGDWALAVAEQHVAEGEQRVTQQLVRLDEFRRAGQPTREAERLLRNLQELLAQFRVHRDQLLRERDFSRARPPPAR